MSCPLCKFALELKPARPLRCGHVFHAHCVGRWLVHFDDKCPICFQYDEIPDRILEHRAKQEESRKKAAAKRAAREKKMENDWIKLFNPS